MTANSKIGWTDATFNPWVGCEKVSPACDHCYAETWAKRSGHPELWQGSRRRTTAANWRQPLKWNREAAATGVRRRVFCASLADVFDNAVPVTWRSDLWDLIFETPHLDWLLLTKRIGNAKSMLPRIGGHLSGFLNIWLGISVVNQEEADRDIPKLLALPAAVRFVSYEPALGPIDFRFDWLPHGSLDQMYPRLNWIIVGGESGAHARTLEIGWVHQVVKSCQASKMACFVKQDSGPRPGEQGRIPDNLWIKEWPR